MEASKMCSMLPSEALGRAAGIVRSRAFAPATSMWQLREERPRLPRCARRVVSAIVMGAGTSYVVFNGARAAVSTATLELYHLAAPEADWNLDVTLEGPIPRLLLSGTAETPVLPGPRPMRLAFIDAPDEVIVGGRRGGLTNGGQDVSFAVRQTEAGARIEGTVVLEWFDFERGSAPFALELALDAVVTTR
jgi:hypothetical protein